MLPIKNITYHNSLNDYIPIAFTGSVFVLGERINTSGLETTTFSTAGYNQHGRTVNNQLMNPQDFSLNFAISNRVDHKDYSNLIGNFANKVTGSFTANKNRMLSDRFLDNVAVDPFEILTEASQATYDAIEANDGAVASILANSGDTGARVQHVFEFDVIDLLNRRFGSEIWLGKTSTTAKARLARQYLTELETRFYGYGMGGGNTRLDCKWWNPFLEEWNYGSWTNISGVTLLSISSTASYNYVDDNGLLRMIVYAPPTNGTDVSAIFTEYVEIELSTVFTPDYFRALRRRYVTSIFNPVLGEGTMTVTTKDDQVYKRKCTVDVAPYFPSGFENSNQVFQRVTVELVGDDPFWYKERSFSETGLTSQTRTIRIVNDGDIATGFNMSVSADNYGAITIENKTTGESIFIDPPTTYTGTIVINTNDGEKAVTDSAGNSLFGWVLENTVFFKLQRGTNEIEVRGSTGTTITAINVIYKDKYVGF